MRQARLVSATWLGLVFPLSGLAADYRYVSFLALPGAPTDQYVSPNGINDDGVIVGEANNQGFIFAHGVTTYVPVAGATETSLRAINRTGGIIGDVFVSVLYQPLGFSFSDLKGVLHPVVGKSGDPVRVLNFNDKGEFLATQITHDPVSGVGAVGEIDKSGPDTTYGYKIYKSKTFAVPGATDTVPKAINDHGQVVGVYYDRTGAHSFLLSDGVYTSVDMPGGVNTFPSGINNHGTVVGTYFDVNKQHDFGFVLKDGVFTTIYPPDAQNDVYVNGIGEGGSIVGFYYTGSGHTGSVGFVARPRD